MVKRRDKKSIAVVIDAGTSLLKVLYRIGDKVNYLVMNPQLLELPLSSEDNLQKSFGLGRPEDNAWVKFDEKLFVVGRLAQEYQAYATVRQLKYESIVPKILAVLSALACRENLSYSFSFNLALLLPFTEYRNGEDIKEELSKYCGNFTAINRDFNLRLRGYQVFPEGAGMAMSYVNSFGIELFQNCNIGYLMFGYRNTSLLVFRHGTLSQSESNTTSLGFYSLIDKVCSQLSGMSRSEVQASIRTVDKRQFNSNSSSNWIYSPSTEFALDCLVKSTDMTKANNERKAIEKAIETASSEYWQLLKSWLNEVLPVNVNLNQVVYCGGASEFVKSQLEAYFKQRWSQLKVSNSQIEQKQLIQALSLNSYQENEFKSQNLALRLADGWGVFVDFSNYSVKNDQVA